MAEIARVTGIPGLWRAQDEHKLEEIKKERKKKVPTHTVILYSSSLRCVALPGQGIRPAKGIVQRRRRSGEKRADWRGTPTVLRS